MFSRSFSFPSALLRLVLGLAAFAQPGIATQITLKASNMAILVKGDVSSGAAVTTDAAAASPNVEWDIGSDGTIKMKDLCLDVTGSSFANGTNVELYQCLGNAAQTWKTDKDSGT